VPRSETTRARVGVSLMFFTNGVLYSALLPRYPELKAAFGLTNAEFGLTVVAFPVGALLAAAFAARAIRWAGTLRVVAVGSALLAVAMLGAASSPVVWGFAAALLVAGAVDAVVDAAQNVQAVVVEQWRGRSMIGSFHALWSGGAASGGAIGAAAAAADVDVRLQMLVNGVVWAAVAVLSCALSRAPKPAAAESEHHASGHVRGSAWKLLLPLVVLAVCGTLIEDVANNWVVLYLGREAGAPAAVAGLGLTVVLVAQLLGRLAGDPLTDRWGRDAVARAGGVLIALGGLLVVLAPVYPLAFLGFALAGLGCAPLVPAAFAAAGRVPGLPEGTGIAVLGWLMRVGFLVTSPAIGWLSDASSLRVAMVIPLAAGVVATVIAQRGVSRTRRAGARTPTAGAGAR
jgi:MFS family permease